MNQLQQDKWAGVTIADLVTDTWDQQLMPREDKPLAMDGILWESQYFTSTKLVC